MSCRLPLHHGRAAARSTAALNPEKQMSGRFDTLTSMYGRCRCSAVDVRRAERSDLVDFTTFDNPHLTRPVYHFVRS